MAEQIDSPPTTPSPIIAELPKGIAIASMVLGIVSIVIFCAWPLSIPCAIVGLILGIIARGKARRGEAGGRGMAKAGIITSTVAIVLAVLVIALQIHNFMRYSRYQMEPPYEETTSIQDDTRTQQSQPVEQESPQVEPGQEHAPSTGAED